MKTHYVGEFLYRCSSVEAARLELDKLYLQDFVAIVLKPASDKEAQVGLCVFNLILNPAAISFATFQCLEMTGRKTCAQGAGSM